MFPQCWRLRYYALGVKADEQVDEGVLRRLFSIVKCRRNNPPQNIITVDKEIKEFATEGVEKHFVIIHKQGGSKSVFFRNENFMRIISPLQLFKAKMVYFTNDTTGDRSEGKELYNNEKLKMLTKGAINGSLTLVYRNNKTYHIGDESSLIAWSKNVANLNTDLAIAKVE